MSKRYSKLFVLIISSLLIFAGFPSQKVYATPSPTDFVIGLGSISGNVGDTVEIPLNVTIPANTSFGNGLGTGDFTVNYDQSKLNIVGLRYPTTFNFTTNTGTAIPSTDWTDQIATTGTSGTTGFGFSPTPVSVSGTPTNVEIINSTGSAVTNVLAYLKVKIMANSTNPLSISFENSSIAVNNNFDPLTTVFQNGQIMVNQAALPFTIGLGSISGNVGDTVEIPLNVTIPANTSFGNGLGTGDFTVNYDQSKLNIVGLRYPTTFNFTTNTGTAIPSTDWTDQIATTGTSGTTGFGFSPTPVSVSGTPTNVEIINSTGSAVTNVLAYLKVKIIADSPNPLSISFDNSSIAVNNNFEPLTTVFQNGQIAVNPSLTVTSVGNIPDIQVANGTSLENANLPTTVQINLSNTTTISASITWNAGNPAYDATQAGTYTFTGTLSNLPTGVTNPEGLTASVNVVVAAPLSKNADLSDLKVEGTTVTGFAPNILSYNVTLAAGTTAVPTVAATKDDPNAKSLTITQATNLTGDVDDRTAIVEVTAEDNATTKTYTVTFSLQASTNADLSDLKVGTTTVAGFAPNVVSYNVILPAGTPDIPTVSATKADANASDPVITQATSLTGEEVYRTAKVEVTAQDNTTKKTYTVIFSVATTPIPGPSLQSALLDVTNKVVTLVYDKALTSNVTDLKSAIKLATNGTTFVALGTDDSVAISSADTKNLIVTLKTPLTGADNKFKIAANSLKDAAGNVQTQVQTTQPISGTIDECFIATAAFGSKNQTDVILLRQFRDQFLLSNPIGKAFVETYYHYSPSVARTIAGSVVLKFVTRVLLLPFVVIVYALFHPILIVGILAGLTFVIAQRRKKRLFNVNN